jgi:hypothetical protein
MSKDSKTTPRASRITIKGIRKAPKPRKGSSWALAVDISLADTNEAGEALMAAEGAAGKWFDPRSPDNSTHLRKPRGANIGGAALAESLARIQDRCHKAAVYAVKKLREPGWLSPEEISAAEIERERAARRQRVDIVGLVEEWVDSVPNEELGVACFRLAAWLEGTGDE